MLKFTTVSGESIRLRHGIILGAITGVTQQGPVPGTATLITTAGNIGPVRITPDEVWEQVRGAEEREHLILLQRSREIEEMRYEVGAKQDA